VTVEVARELFPQVATLGRISPGKPVEVRDASGNVLGSLLDTSAVAAGNPGYGGPVPCAIGMTPGGQVAGVRLLPNDESPTFVEFVVEQGLLDTWNGLTAAAAVAKPVDAVSGATVTSLAISGSVQQTLAAVGTAQAPSARPARTRWLPWGVLALALLSFFGGGRRVGLRLLLRATSVAVLGFMAGSSLSLVLAQNWLAQGVPWGRFPFFTTLAAIAVLVPVLTGRSFYCAHACPFGNAQDLAGMLWPWWKPRLPRLLAAPLHALRGAGVLTLYVLLAAGVAVDLAAVEPFAAFQWRSAPWPALVLAGSFLLLAVVMPRTWCQHLCPTGYVLERCRGIQPPEGARPRFFSFERGALVAAVAAAIAITLHPADTPRRAGGEPAATPAPATAEAETPHPHTIPDVLTVIHERRSVRHYSGEPVLPAQLDTLVRAAMAAPSAGNAQPWAFVVVTERKRLQELAANLPYGKMLAQAGAALIVCGVSEKTLPGEAAPFWVQDCSAAAQNVLLAAQGLGLGAVWVGIYPLEERLAAVRAACAIPSGVQPLCVISLGQPAGVEQPKDKYSADNVHWEKW
jgi:nitroreductase